MAQRDPTEDLTIPDATRHVLEDLCSALAGALGDDLVSVVLHGSAARGDWEEGVSDLNLLIVTREAGLTQCDAVLPHLRKAQRRAPIDAELITSTDLERSTDVFPLKFLNIQRTHVTLAGEQVVSELEIAWDHLRLRVEQLIKEQLSELRQRYLLHAGQPEKLDAVLTQSVSAFLVGVGALLFLRDGQWWLSGKESIAQAAARELALDEELLDTLLALQRRRLELDTAQLHDLYDQFMTVVDEVAAMVDQLEGA